jgi:ligand-binding SRPBCC domain-containing protein
MTTIVVERSTRLAAPPDEVWRHAISMVGVNAELAPIRMSHPAGRTELSDDVELGTPLFISTVRLGPIPLDRHELTLVGLEPGRWFQEESRSRLHRVWRHRRTVTPDGAGCVVTDRLEVVPRLPGTGATTRLVVGSVFARRHRVLAARFGRR